MAIIKTVTNGDRTIVFKAVSLGHAVTILFGLLSIIGAQQTWLWASAHERSVISAQVAEESKEHGIVKMQIATLDMELRALRTRFDAAERQININTGKIEQGLH